EVDVGLHEGDFVPPAAEGAVRDGVGVDVPLAAGLNPLAVSRVAVRAEDPRVPVDPVSVLAARKHELAVLRAVEARLHDVRIWLGDRLVVFGQRPLLLIAGLRTRGTAASERPPGSVRRS